MHAHAHARTHACTHRLLIFTQQFPSWWLRGAKHLNMAAVFTRNPPHALCLGRVTDKALHQSRPLTAACSHESYHWVSTQPKQLAFCFTLAWAFGWEDSSVYNQNAEVRFLFFLPFFFLNLMVSYVIWLSIAHYLKNNFGRTLMHSFQFFFRWFFCPFASVHFFPLKGFTIALICYIV